MRDVRTGDARLDRRLLIVDKERKHRAWLSRIARSIVTSVDVLDEISSFNPSGYDLVLINRDGIEEADRMRILGGLRESRGEAGAPHPLLISSAESGYQELFQECQAYGLMNLLARNGGGVDAVELIVTMQKILKDDIFGLEKYFPWGVPERKRTIRSSEERHEIVEEAEAYARDLKVPPRLCERFCTVVDELTTNALFDAPVDEEGNRLYAHMSRSQEVKMEPGKEAVVKLCCDAYHLGVSVEDQFGALDADECVGHLVRCFRKAEARMNEKQGGAGLGLYFSFDAMSHMVVNLAKGRRTEVIGLIDVQGTYRDFASRIKSFNSFVEAS